MRTVWAEMRRVSGEHPALLAIVAAGAAVRLTTLGQPFWSDENLALQVLMLKPADMLPRIEVAETNPPLYFLIAAPWERVFGDGEFALRSLSALCGIAMVPVVYASTAILAKRRAATVAAALTAASPFLIWYSQELRPYALFALLSAVSFLAFAALLRERAAHWLWIWAIASALSAMTHYLGALLFAIEAAVLFWSLRDRRREVGLAVVAVGVTGLALLPLVFVQEGLTGWIADVSRDERLAQIPQHFLIGMNEPGGFVGPLAVLLVGAALIYVFVRGDRATLRMAALGGGVFAAGVAILLAAALAGTDYVNTRNLIGLWGPFAALLGAVLAAPALRGFGIALAGLLSVGGVALAIWTAATPETARPDWNEVADAIGPAPEGRVIYTQSGLTAPLRLYVDGGVDAQLGQVVSTSEIDVLSLRPVANYSVGPCWWLGACGGRNLLSSPAPPPEPPAEFELVGSEETSLFRIDHYRAPQSVELPPAGFGGVLIQPATPPAS